MLRYDEAKARGYRAADEQVLSGQDYVRMRDRLRAFTASERPLSLLDIGCGTGRWFHCFENLERLVGIDTSPEMLAHARDPVAGGAARTAQVDLIEADLFSVPAALGPFDRIVSIGCLGEHAPFDLEVAQRLLDLLRPAGRALFTIVDRTSLPRSWRREAADKIARALPAGLRAVLDARRATFAMTRRDLERVLQPTPFASCALERWESTGERWTGAYFVCTAERNAERP